MGFAVSRTFRVCAGPAGRPCPPYLATQMAAPGAGSFPSASVKGPPEACIHVFIVKWTWSETWLRLLWP